MHHRASTRCSTSQLTSVLFHNFNAQQSFRVAPKHDIPYNYRYYVADLRDEINGRCREGNYRFYVIL